MTPDAPKEFNLGDQVRQKVMLPGEVFLGNFEVRPSIVFNTPMQDRAGYRPPTVDEMVKFFKDGGQFLSVRTIAAISTLGTLIPKTDMEGIVGIPNPAPKVSS